MTTHGTGGIVILPTGLLIAAGGRGRTMCQNAQAGRINCIKDTTQQDDVRWREAASLI